MAAAGAAKVVWTKGQKCQALWEDGNWYYAVIEEVNAAEDVYLVAYDSSDLKEYVYGTSLRPAGTPIDDGSASKGDSGATSQMAKRRGSVRRLSLSAGMRAVVNLLEKENEFGQSLAVLDKYFVDPARRVMGIPQQRLLEQEDFDVLFAQLDPIRQLNAKLLTDLDQRFDATKPGEVPAIGDIFLNFAPFFKLYSDYISHHDRKVVPLLEKLPAKFKNYVKNCEASPGVSMRLEQYLELPARQLSQYADLLRAVLDATPAGSRDRAPLEKATAAIAAAVEAVRSVLVTRRNLDTVVEIEKKFIGSPGFSKPGRAIVREGTLLKKPREIGAPDVEYRFFLFTDMLAYASSIGWKLKLHSKIDINYSFHVRKLRPGRSGEHRILVASSTKSIVLQARDEASCDAWVSAIEACVAEVRRSIPERLRTVPPPVAPLPVWLSFDDVPRVEEIFPVGSTTGGIGHGHTVGESKDSRDPTRDAVQRELLPTVKTVGVGGSSTPIQAGQDTSLRLSGGRPAAHAVGETGTTAHAAAGGAGGLVMAQRQQHMNSGAPSVPPAVSSPGAASGRVAKFCSSCGAKRPSPDAKFCDQCGTKY